MKIAKVVPQTRLPRGTNFFDYKVPDSLQNLKPGSFVKIPLRRQILSGIVFEIFETQVQPTYELKEIVEITENSLSANLLKLVRLSAEDIFVSPSIIIQAVVAEQPAKKQPSRKILAPPALIPLKFKPEQIEPLVRSFKEIQSTSGSILCHCPGDKEKKALIYKVIEAGLKEKKKIILISPTINQVNEWLGLLTPLAPESMSVLHGGQNKNTHWQNWQNIEQNIAQLVIGTRQAIFAPFGRVDEIIFDESENDDLKQSDQNPRYDSRDVALNRAQIDSAKVIFFSQTPQISTYYLTESNPPQLKYISLPAQPLTSVKVLNLKDVETEIDFRLSRELLETTRECLLTNQRVFLLINQKGLASTLSCSDCFHAFICPHCRVTLAQEKDYLNCRLCQYQEPTPGFCPKCHGTHLKSSGLGIQKLEDILKKNFPSTIIDHVDQQKPEYNPQAQIILGTTLFVNRYMSQMTNLGLIGVISIDNLLNLPDLNAGERALQLLNKLTAVATEKQVPLLIQTFNPENYVIKASVTQDYKLFFQAVLSEKKILNYPPFSQLIKLGFKDHAASVATAQAEKIKKEITSQFPRELEILGPTPLYKQHQFFQTSLILKTSAVSPELKNFLSLLPNDIIIDKNPVLLL